MKPSSQRDESIERWLRQSRHVSHALPEAKTDTCLDPEMLAAWTDGGLDLAARELAMSHVADCTRCQAMVGTLAHINQGGTTVQPARVTRRWQAWILPVSAAAAAVMAVAVWVSIPRDVSAPLTSVKQEVPQREAASGAAVPGTTGPTTAPSEEKAADARANERQVATPNAPGSLNEAVPLASTLEARRDAERQELPTGKTIPGLGAIAASGATTAGATTAVDSAAAQAGSAAATAGVVIVSPDPAVRWRLTRTAVERSTNGGSTWHAVPTGVVGELTAGTAPSTLVCWVVGRGGLVLVTDDGQTWRRVPFPEPSSLSAVRATDASSASVTTADRRVFSTIDGGATWIRTAPQDF